MVFVPKRLTWIEMLYFTLANYCVMVAKKHHRSGNLECSCQAIPFILIACDGGMRTSALVMLMRWHVRFIQTYLMETKDAKLSIR